MGVTYFSRLLPTVGVGYLFHPRLQHNHVGKGRVGTTPPPLWNSRSNRGSGMRAMPRNQEGMRGMIEGMRGMRYWSLKDHGGG
eukprot:764091-Hanusia_phi.AAC.14